MKESTPGDRVVLFVVNTFLLLKTILTVTMTDSDLSEMSSTSDVNYSDIDFDTPNTTDMKLSDVSDYPCDGSSVVNISFEKVNFYLFEFCTSLCVAIM